MSPSFLVAALAFVASTAALSNLQIPSTATPDQNVTITWSSDSSDTTPLTLALFSADSNQTFAGGLAIANNVDLQNNQVTVLFPQLVAPGQYTVGFLNATNSSQVVTSSNQFAVAPAASSTASGSGSGSSASRTVSGSGSSATATAPPSSISNSLSSALNSIASGASSEASSLRSAASSALSSALSASSGSSSASGSNSATAGAALALKPMWSTGASLAVSVVLGGLALGAVAL